MGGRPWLGFVAAAALAGAAHGQPVLRLLAFVPPQSPTAADAVQLRFDVTSTSTTACSLWFFRDDGPQTQVSSVVPGSGPFLVSLALPSGVDGRQVRFTGFVQQPPGGLVPGDRQAAIEVDDVGPGTLTITSPAFPHTAYQPDVTVRGTVRKVDGTAEAGGRVVATRQDGGHVGEVVGGGILTSDGAFGAALGVGTFPTGTAVPVRFRAYDRAGNAGAQRDVTVTYAAGGGAVSLTGLSLTPPSGTLTNNPAVVVRGTVSGTAPPFTVTFLVDGFVESSLAGLASGTAFAHTLVLPGDGTHAVSVRMKNAAGAAFGPLSAGSVTLDRAAPAPPSILVPDPSRPFVTNQDRFTVAGVTSGLGTGGQVLLRAATGRRFTPAQPQTVAADGTFETAVDVSGLPDGTYVIEAFARDAAGNWSAAPGLLGVGRGAPGRNPGAVDQVAARRLRRAGRAGAGAFGLTPDELAAAERAFRERSQSRSFERLHRAPRR